MSLYSSTNWSCRTQKSSSPRCGIVYTRRSHPQSLSVAYSISDPTTLQIQSVATPLVRRSPRVSEEIAALEANHTWDIEPCPPTIVPLGCKGVYSVKVRFDGSLDRYKVRLVALGNNQEYGVKYEETFAPMAKMITVCTILALAASSDWPLH
ncbi:uncharacterized mitochondrial protein AtMg00820-like [Vitis riparia]|uniref:uncharacterized mitochondrial protein AtMg00820-like n=1 Tax=Vitis riparia TaxID=96939 RepID=UPI00155A6774|nr:uncharacterized mitochondrial protein AtMg00820-like [Vitis riparia]